jgi:hypothetical protein
MALSLAVLLSSLSTTPAVGLSLTVLFIVFVTTPAVGLSLLLLFVVFVNDTSGRFVTEMLFVVFVNDTSGGFVTDSVICRLCQQHRRCVCHWQCYLSSLSTTPEVGLSLAVLFVVFFNNTGGGFVTCSVICRLCQ